MSHTITNMISLMSQCVNVLHKCHVPCVNQTHMMLVTSRSRQNLKIFSLPLYKDLLHEFSYTLKHRPNNVLASEQQKDCLCQRGRLSLRKCFMCRDGENTHAHIHISGQIVYLKLKQLRIRKLCNQVFPKLSKNGLEEVYGPFSVCIPQED